jgi:hypothetical protein
MQVKATVRKAGTLNLGRAVNCLILNIVTHLSPNLLQPPELEGPSASQKLSPMRGFSVRELLCFCDSIIANLRFQEVFHCLPQCHEVFPTRSDFFADSSCTVGDR